MSTFEAAPSFDDVAGFVRDFAGLGSRKVMTPTTRLDADLGVTGHDGNDLLLAAAKHFDSQLVGADGFITTFNLSSNECLFGAEGLGLPGIGFVLGRMSGCSKLTVRDLTLGELHDAIRRHRVSPAGAT